MIARRAQVRPQLARRISLGWLFEQGASLANAPARRGR